MTYDPKTKGVSFKTIKQIIAADLDPKDYGISKEDMQRYNEFIETQKKDKQKKRTGGKIYSNTQSRKVRI